MSKNNSETVTISKAEYESLKSHCAQLESELNWLKEQLQISKKKTFGSNSERTEQLYEQMSLFFNEAEALEDTENRNTEITVEQYKRKQKLDASTSSPRTSRPTLSSMSSAKKSANVPSEVKRWRSSAKR